MSIHIHSEQPISQLPEAAKELAQRTVDNVKDIANTVEGATKDIYQSTTCRAEETLATSKEYVRRNPVPAVLGAVAFGVAIGYLLVRARRRSPFGDSHSDAPLLAVREAVLAALAPISDRVHKGYDSAREGAGKVVDNLHHMGSGHREASLSDQIGRIGSNLKFW